MGVPKLIVIGGGLAGLCGVATAIMSGRHVVQIMCAGLHREFVPPRL
jgi:succinate dehydrogenase/fumarate reductase flavoprotein subunit